MSMFIYDHVKTAVSVSPGADIVHLGR